MGEDKRVPFGKRFNMLGAVVDLSHSMEGEVLIMNKESRVQELVATVNKLVEGAQFNESALQSLRGRLLYAAGNTFGRCTQVAVQALGRLARKGTSTFLDAELLKCIQFAISTLASAQPRRITAWKNEWPVLIFTVESYQCAGKIIF